MTQLTLEIPNDLASRLQPMQSRMLEIIELGLLEIAPTENDLHNEVIEFLASGPSQQDIIAFRPSEQVVERVSGLLYKNQERSLTPQEQAELDQYEQLDYLMTLIKARARLQQAQTT